VREGQTGSLSPQLKLGGRWGLHRRVGEQEEKPFGEKNGPPGSATSETDNLRRPAQSKSAEIREPKGKVKAGGCKRCDLSRLVWWGRKLDLWRTDL